MAMISICYCSVHQRGSGAMTLASCGAKSLHFHKPAIPGWAGGDVDSDLISELQATIPKPQTHAARLLAPAWGSVGLDRVSREKFHAQGLSPPAWPRRQLGILRVLTRSPPPPRHLAVVLGTFVRPQRPCARTLIAPSEATNTGAAPGGVTSKNG